MVTPAGHLAKRWGVGFGERRMGPPIPCSTGWDCCEMCFPYCHLCIRYTETKVKKRRESSREAALEKEAAEAAEADIFGETNDDKGHDDQQADAASSDGGNGGENAKDNVPEDDADDSHGNGEFEGVALAAVAAADGADDMGSNSGDEAAAAPPMHDIESAMDGFDDDSGGEDDYLNVADSSGGGNEAAHVSDDDGDDLDGDEAADPSNAEASSSAFDQQEGYDSDASL